MGNRIIVAAASGVCLAALTLAAAPAASAAHDSTRHAVHFCSRVPTSKHIGPFIQHNDPFAGMNNQKSCITVTSNGHRITIDTNYRPYGNSVVAYDAIGFGRYFHSDDPQYGVPGPINSIRTVLHVTMSGGSGSDYLGDVDLWFDLTGANGLHHIREMIIAYRWHDYGPYCDPYKVRAPHAGLPNGKPLPGLHRVSIRHTTWHAGACMTGGGTGNRHLLMRFLIGHRVHAATLHLADFLRIARHHHWISNAMTVDSVGMAPECWHGCRRMTYSMTPSTR